MNFIFTQNNKIKNNIANIVVPIKKYKLQAAYF